MLDSIGAAYLENNLASLAVGGRLVLIGLMGGAKAEINLGVLLMRRLSVIGSTLRARPVEEKAAIVRGFLARFGDDLAAGAHSRRRRPRAAARAGRRGAPRRQGERALREDRADAVARRSFPPLGLSPRDASARVRASFSQGASTHGR